MSMSDDEMYQDILRRWNALADAVEKLYFAGYWHCDRPVDEKALWTAIRDAARIPPGMTHLTLGEDRSKQPEGVTIITRECEMCRGHLLVSPRIYDTPEPQKERS